MAERGEFQSSNTVTVWLVTVATAFSFISEMNHYSSKQMCNICDKAYNF